MKITNIGIVNIQNASKETLASIEEISKVGFLVGSEDAFRDIEPCTISNIGMRLKVPAGMPLVFHDESLILDDNFLASLPEKTAFLVNGDCIIQTIDTSLVTDKIYQIYVNGNTYLPAAIKGLITTLGHFNGRMIAFESDSTFFKQPLLLTESLLFRLPKRVSTNRLRALDPKLLASLESFESMEVLDSCWIERGLFQSWKNKLHLDLSAELQLFDAPVRYHGSDETMSLDDLSKIQESTLAVDGTLTLTGVDLENKLKITSICCKTLRARESVIEELKPLLLPGVQVETLESNRKKNHGKMILSASQLSTAKNPMRIKNYASLIFDESVTEEMVNKGIAQIENYGVVKGPDQLMTILAEKTSKNYGKIKPLEIVKEENEKEYTYENLGYLVL